MLNTARPPPGTGDSVHLRRINRSAIRRPKMNPPMQESPSEANMDEHEMRSRMAIEAAGMEVWDSTVVNGKVVEGVIRWSARGAAMIGLPARDTAQPFAEFLALVHEADRDGLLRT